MHQEEQLRPVRMVLKLDSHCWSSPDRFFGAVMMTHDDTWCWFLVCDCPACRNTKNWEETNKIGCHTTKDLAKRSFKMQNNLYSLEKNPVFFGNLNRYSRTKVTAQNLTMTLFPRNSTWFLSSKCNSLLLHWYHSHYLLLSSLSGQSACCWTCHHHIARHFGGMLTAGDEEIIYHCTLGRWSGRHQ